MASKVLKLYDYQKEAIEQLKSGKILLGGVGSGKTLTSLIFYRTNYLSRKLYVVTTAKKRDTKDWESEANLVGIVDISVDSWNNIKKYEGVTDAFFIFDEQKISGYGAWSKSFLKITKKNKWILLSATPGDTWLDYVTIFVANGYFRNKTDFANKHIVYDRFAKYPKVKRYLNETRLMSIRKAITVSMVNKKKTMRNDKYYICGYDTESYKRCFKDRWDVFNDKPCVNVSALIFVLRRLVNGSDDRKNKAIDILKDNQKVIVFYNYNYELDILENACKEIGKPYSQWNGHKHEEILDSDEWVYICHYASAEGWNCIETNCILFYSLNYSYRIMEQASGRIDRSNTPFVDLNYHYLMSKSSIDNSILKALKSKKTFNESSFYEKF